MTFTNSLASHPLSILAREITDEVISPVTLQQGKTYMHPEYGAITITGGYYRDPTYGRVSNRWSWTVVETGEEGHGYGADWPEVTER